MASATAGRLSYRTIYYTFVTLVLYFVPVLVMSLAYVVIVGKLWSHRRPGEGRDFDMSAQLELTVKKKVTQRRTTKIHLEYCQTLN